MLINSATIPLIRVPGTSVGNHHFKVVIIWFSDRAGVSTTNTTIVVVKRNIDMTAIYKPRTSFVDDVGIIICIIIMESIVTIKRQFQQVIINTPFSYNEFIVV